ncbi:uncharacterized protein LOC143294048 [Babylonia areolata]|uniref:uncharacterized protein LOC143294048 n=1 Tax=Babylonia areolata TaxID=304850 RepID=UPI003FD5CF68
MDGGSTLALVVGALVLLVAPLYSASPVLVDLWSEERMTSESEPLCPQDWDRFRHICWSFVPELATMTLLDGDAQADRYCQERGALALRVYQLYVCVKDTRQKDTGVTEDMLRRELSNRQKRLMGNNGY